MELQGLKLGIQQYGSWFDNSFISLSIMRELTMAFPEDGSVTAKTVEIRDNNTVTCTGTAQSQTALNKTLKQLSAMSGVTEVKLQSERGKSPMQFTIEFHYQYANGRKP